MCRDWWKRGVRHRPVRQTLHVRHIFAAVEPGTDNAFALVPALGAPRQSKRSSTTSPRIGPDEHVVMVLDQAGWHGAVALECPIASRLLPLPPATPRTNPVAWVWEYMNGEVPLARATPTTTPSPTP